MSGDDSQKNPRPRERGDEAPSERSQKDPPRARAPGHAERCRTLLSLARSATLSTLARDPAGFPYGSLVSVADMAGRPLLLLSRLAEHTQNLAADPRASVLVTESLEGRPEPLSQTLVTILGPCRPVDEGERDEVRSVFLAAHPEAAQYVDFKDFAFYRVEPAALRIVEGFGRMSWVGADEHLKAEPDPIARGAASILAHMNEDHQDAMLDFARGLCRVGEASAVTMTAVDRYGFEMMVTTPQGIQRARLGFASPVATSDEVRKAMVALVKAARAVLASP